MVSLKALRAGWGSGGAVGRADGHLLPRILSSGYALFKSLPQPAEAAMPTLNPQAGLVDSQTLAASIYGSRWSSPESAAAGGCRLSLPAAAGGCRLSLPDRGCFL